MTESSATDHGGMINPRVGAETGQVFFSKGGMTHRASLSACWKSKQVGDLGCECKRSRNFYLGKYLIWAPLNIGTTVRNSFLRSETLPGGKGQQEQAELMSP